MEVLDSFHSEIISDYEGWLILSKIGSINTEQATWLSKFKCNDLSLNCVEQIDEETAKVLSGFQGGYLELCGLRTISPEGIKI